MRIVAECSNKRRLYNKSLNSNKPKLERQKGSEMLKRFLMLIAIVGGLSGCTTIYTDSAPASNGGQFVSGSHSSERAMFYCPADKTASCKQIEVELK